MRFGTSLKSIFFGCLRYLESTSALFSLTKWPSWSRGIAIANGYNISRYAINDA